MEDRLYLYSRPSWTAKVIVEVKKGCVYFKDNFCPVQPSDIPYDAIFEPVVLGMEIPNTTKEKKKMDDLELAFIKRTHRFVALCAYLGFGFGLGALVGIILLAVNCLPS